MFLYSEENRSLGLPVYRNVSGEKLWLKTEPTYTTFDKTERSKVYDFW
jgi:hypothetical protein